MIKQQFFYNDEEILRLYHNGFLDYPNDQRMEKIDEIKDGQVILKECWIENLEDEVISYDYLASGFLSSSDEKNPYGTYCCDYKEFITDQKSLVVDGRLENPDIFRQISDFIKKWSGFDLNKAPFSSHNVLIFTPTETSVELNLCKENDRHISLKLIENQNGILTCIAKFRQSEIIVDSKVMIISANTFVETEKAWDSVDIELFVEDRLVYAYYNLSFIRSIYLDMTIATKRVKIPLEYAKKTITLEQGVSEPMEIGDRKNSNALSTYQYQEKLLKRSLTIGKRFEFLTKNQYNHGLDIFESIAGTRGYQEMWIFDPYFTTSGSVGGRARLNDIITVLGKNLNLKKKVVFESNEEDIHTNFTDFRKATYKTLKFLEKRDVNLNFEFIGVKEHFHDRFIFLKSESSLKAFQLGTSFNSFGDNYSTIIELDSFDGITVFETLINEVVRPENIILQEELS
ncbi:VPA1262 family N-terminal domain-containing protein [Planomicrobium okeanokoites]|uniref:VPA1262 family N-terminal domain-containing protein n=1 Tax=Planomicrobium okeanokoites TaxID=244 RepID=UPI00248F7B9E|nr:VPA1262 family N-terminal domain-containing protein [Planomicrobium okeanokoites]